MGCRRVIVAIAVVAVTTGVGCGELLGIGRSEDDPPSAPPPDDSPNDTGTGSVASDAKEDVRVTTDAPLPVELDGNSGVGTVPNGGACATSIDCISGRCMPGLGQCVADGCGLEEVMFVCGAAPCCLGYQCNGGVCLPTF